mgnify:CR=1 FL=1
MSGPHVVPVRVYLAVFAALQLLLRFTSFGLRLRADTHIYAGALATNPGDPLYFSNGGGFDATSSAYGLPQVLRTNGLNAGHYRGDALRFAQRHFEDNRLPAHRHWSDLFEIHPVTVIPLIKERL